MLQLNDKCFKIFMFTVAQEFEIAVSIFTDLSLYNLLYDKEYYIRILKYHLGGTSFSDFFGKCGNFEGF